MNALIIARISVSIIGALMFIVNRMFIQENKNTEAIAPFIIGVACSIGVWFIQ